MHSLKKLLRTRRGIFVTFVFILSLIFISYTVSWKLNIRCSKLSRREIAQAQAQELLIQQRKRTTKSSGGYFHRQCNCTKHYDVIRVPLSRGIQSTCNEEADWLGKSQRIVSFSLYEDPKPKSSADDFSLYIEGIPINVMKLKELYPGWTIRIYMNVELDSEFCTYACLDEITWCNIKESPLGNLENVNPRVWRYLVLGDPTADIFVSRDLDSMITEREREGVTEWELSPYAFYLARDGHNFKRSMSAGAWGAKNYDLTSIETVKLRQDIIKLSKGNFSTTLDEDLLEELIFYPYNKTILAHDSYSCLEFTAVPNKPFPKRRKDKHTYVTKEIRLQNFEASECPIECRPAYGKNWTYC